MNPVFFKKQSDLRKWFKKNADTATMLLIGYYRVSTGKPSITWSQSVDEALCFGWIDSVRMHLTMKVTVSALHPSNYTASGVQGILKR